MTSTAPVPRSLAYATDIDTLPYDRVLTRRDGYLVVRSPSNPSHWWGNMLLFDDPPDRGDGERWEARFAAEFADVPEVRHRTFAWDRTDGEEGAASAELVARGYELERSVGLVAAPARLRPHPRANAAVEIRALDPAPGADETLWEGVIEVQVAGNDDRRVSDPEYERFARARQRELRALFAAGRGAWYVARDPGDGTVVASCGVVATAGRGRFQQVDTAAAHRRRGIASRLVVEAARDAASRYDLTTLVIVADAGYHALGLYESLGFHARERVRGACRPAPGPGPEVA